MISIITCSRENAILAKVKQNISETVGREFELIVIDNSENRYSIFEAYNEGVRQAKGNLLCFMHEDVLYRSKDWGGVMERHFQEDERMGLIGFSGSHFLPDTPM